MDFTTSTNQAGVPFDEFPRYECGDDCPECAKYYGYSHVRCCDDGEILYAEGGGGDDGRSIAGYTDATRCRECREWICLSHARNFNGLTPLCRECEHEAEAREYEDLALENGLAQASEDIRTTHTRMLRETNTKRLQQIRDIHIACLKTQILLLEKAIDNKLAAHNAIPFIFGGAV